MKPLKILTSILCVVLIIAFAGLLYLMPLVSAYDQYGHLEEFTYKWQFGGCLLIVIGLSVLVTYINIK